MVLKVTEAMGADNKIFWLVLTIPMATVSALGHTMSFASGSIVEATAMEFLSAGSEIVEYFTYAVYPRPAQTPWEPVTSRPLHSRHTPRATTRHHAPPRATTGHHGPSWAMMAMAPAPEMVMAWAPARATATAEDMAMVAAGAFDLQTEVL